MDSMPTIPDGWLRDPGHEGDAQPMKALKGGMAAPNVQQPMGGANTGPARTVAPDATDAASPTSGYLAGTPGPPPAPRKT